VAHDKRDGQLLSLVYLVFIVCLLEPERPDRPDEPDQPSFVAPFSPVSRERGIGIFGAICGYCRIRFFCFYSSIGSARSFR
jgi:hypothetical protein